MNEHSKVENYKMELRTEERMDDSIEVSWIENPSSCYPNKAGGNICNKSSLSTFRGPAPPESKKSAYS